MKQLVEFKPVFIEGKSIRLYPSFVILSFSFPNLKRKKKMKEKRKKKREKRKKKPVVFHLSFTLLLLSVFSSPPNISYLSSFLLSPRGKKSH
jgi:Na+/H+ antiporter NhaD/arsenite permease-like protein